MGKYRAEMLTANPRVSLDRSSLFVRDHYAGRNIYKVAVAD